MEVKEKFEFKSEALRKAREKKGYKQDELAKQVFTTRQSISNWENGKKTPTLENVDRLAKILDVSIDDLIVRKVEEKLNTNDEELVNYDYHNYDLVCKSNIKNNKKHFRNSKFIKIILALVLIVLIIYLGSSIRKFIILYDIHRKMNNYVGIDNYYLKINNWTIRDNSVLSFSQELWKKDNNYKIINEVQNQLTINYIFNNRMYTVNEENKSYVMDEQINVSGYQYKIESELFTPMAKNINDMISNSLNLNVKILNANYYYISYRIKSGEEENIIEEKIDKQTGLITEYSSQINSYSTIKKYIFKYDIVDENIEFTNIDEYHIEN